MKAVSKILIDLVASHGEDIIQQPQRLKAMLADLLPHEKRMRYLLEVSLRAEIPAKLKDIQQAETEVRETKTNSLKHYFKEEYFLEDNAVKSVFDCWGEVVLFIDSMVLSVEYDDSEGEYIDEFGVKYNLAKTKLIKFSENLFEYDILPGTKVICNNAFYGYSELKSIFIPDSVELIGHFDSWENDELEKFIVSPSNSKYCTIDGVLYSKDRTNIIRFPPAKSVSEFILPLNVENIEKYAFQCCKLVKSIVIPHSVNKIHFSSFNECESLEEITVDDTNNVFSSLNGVLYTKDKKKIIRFPAAKKEIEYRITEGVEMIVSMAFDSCTNLETVEIPDSVTQIGYRAFYNCSKLNQLVIPEKVFMIEESAFSGCIALNSLSISKNNKQFEIKKRSLIDLADNKLLYYPIQSNYSRYKIPDGVISIGYFAFFFNCLLEEISFPDSVKTLEPKSFILCRNLEHVYLPTSIESIGQSAFFMCQKLRSVTFKNSNTSIKKNIFNHCDKLELICIDYANNSTDFKLFDELTEIFKNQESTIIIKTSLWSQHIFQTIETIAEKIAREVIKNRAISQDKIQSIFNGYHNAFLKTHNGFKKNGVENGIAHTKEYLSNWKAIEKLVLKKYILSFGVDIQNGIELENNQISSTFTEFRITTSIHLFLSFITSGKKHYLTKESLFESFTNVFEGSKNILSESDKTIESVLFKLNEYNKDKDLPWLTDLIEKLTNKELDQDIVTEFVEIMTN
jgi:hypothetical protein